MKENKLSTLAKMRAKGENVSKSEAHNSNA